MPSSPSTSLRLEEMFTGEQINLWGTLLNQVISMLDAAIAGMATIPLTGNYALTSHNFVADEARNAVIKLTGTTGPWSVTIPSVTKLYIVWNATSATQVITAGAGTTVSVDAGDIVLVFCDAVNVKELGYAGLGLKAYISAATLAATGTLPALTGNAGKFIYTDGVNALWKSIASTDLSDYATNIKGLQVALAVAL